MTELLAAGSREPNALHAGIVGSVECANCKWLAFAVTHFVLLHQSEM